MNNYIKHINVFLLNVLVLLKSLCESVHVLRARRRNLISPATGLTPVVFPGQKSDYGDNLG